MPWTVGGATIELLWFKKRWLQGITKDVEVRAPVSYTEVPWTALRATFVFHRLPSCVQRSHTNPGVRFSCTGLFRTRFRDQVPAPKAAFHPRALGEQVAVRGFERTGRIIQLFGTNQIEMSLTSKTVLSMFYTIHHAETPNWLND